MPVRSFFALMLTGLLALCLLYAPASLASAPAHSASPAKTAAPPPKAAPVNNAATVSSPSASSTSNSLVKPSPAQPLDEVFQQTARTRRFLNPAYLMRVGLVLMTLLGAFYLVARFILPRWTGGRAARPASGMSAQGPAMTGKPSPLFQRIMPQTSTLKQAADLRPRVLARTRLGQSREILVVEVDGHQLIIGATAQQMTLLKELPAESEAHAPYPPQNNTPPHPAETVGTSGMTLPPPVFSTSFHSEPFS